MTTAPVWAAELRSALMVKVALGERGRPWWEQTAAERKQRWEAAVPLPGSRQAPAARPDG